MSGTRQTFIIIRLKSPSKILIPAKLIQQRSDVTGYRKYSHHVAPINGFAKVTSYPILKSQGHLSMLSGATIAGLKGLGEAGGGGGLAG